MRDEFSPEMLDAMRKGRAHPGNLKRVPLPKGSPQTATIALPGLRAYEDAALSGSETGGYVLGLAPVGDDTMFLRKDRDPVTVAHEAEHLLAKRQLEHPSEINTAFDSLVEDKRSPSIRHQFVIDAVSAYPYLQDKYGLQSAYFEPGMYNYQRRAGVASNLLYEQLASLASIEQMQGVDLTKDPVLRETLFKDKDVRETYNALVGLRQTRLDSKDIRPHTRIAEPSMLDKVKKAIGFAEGGEVKDFFGDRDPNEPITPEQIEEFNRYINEHLQKQRKKEEEWDYPYRENDAILAKGYSNGGEATKGSEYDPLFQAAGEKYGVDPSILRAIASVESNFNPQAVGPKTRSGRAQGMMQFIPATAKAYGLQDPFNPEQSVDAAARLMRDLQKQFKGDVGKALEAYNGGPRLVGKSKQTAKYREMVLARAGRTPSDDIPTPAEPFMAARSAPTQLKQGQMYGEAPKTRPEAPRTVSMGTIEAMPLNYRTAFALQYLADNEPDDDPEVKANDLLARLDELELSEGTGGKSALTSFFAETTAPTPTAFQIMQSKKQKQQERQKRALPSMQVVRGFRDGGEVDISEQMTVGTLPKDAKDYREVLEGLKKSAADIRRGIQYFPADVVGSGVDIANMVLTPFGLGSDKPFMGSQYLIDKGVEAGIYEKPSGSGVETLTRMAGLPALATRSVGRGIAALEESLQGPPVGSVGMKAPGASYSFLPSMEHPFVGRIDKHVANLPYPVQKEAFINSLKGKFKAYEIDRVQEALEEIPASQKLTSSDILNALQKNQFYNPSNYKVEIIPPGQIPKSEMYEDVDVSIYPADLNPAQGNSYSMGVIHLKHDRPEVANIEDIQRRLDVNFKFASDPNEGPLDIYPSTSFVPRVGAPVTNRPISELEGMHFSNVQDSLEEWVKGLEKVPGVSKESVERAKRAVNNFPKQSAAAFDFSSISQTLREPLLYTQTDSSVGNFTSGSLRVARRMADADYQKTGSSIPVLQNQHAEKEVVIAALKQLEDHNFDVSLMLDARNIKDRLFEVDMASWRSTNDAPSYLGLNFNKDKIRSIAENPKLLDFSPPKNEGKYGWEKSLRELADKDHYSFLALAKMVGMLSSNNRATLLASHPNIASKLSGVNNPQAIQALQSTALEMGYPPAFPINLMQPGYEVDRAKKAIEIEMMNNLPDPKAINFAKLSAHSSLQPPVDAISFSRFINVLDQTDPSNVRKGIHLTELQSDRRKLAESLGTPKENPQTDAPKIAKLEEKLDEAAAAREDYITEWKRTNPSRDINEETDPEFAKLQRKVQSISRQLRLIKKRPSLVGTDAPLSPGTKLPVYGVQESFPGMVTRGEDLQILMMKAGVDGAIRQGAQFVTFPGSESAQPQLYSMVEKNMQAVAKELGPPFRVEEVTVKTFDPKDRNSTNPNALQVFIKKPAIVWDDPEKAEKVVKKGIPFSKGGFVTKPLYDRA